MNFMFGIFIKQGTELSEQPIFQYFKLTENYRRC